MEKYVTWKKFKFWDKISASIKNEFDNEPVHKKFLKTKIKFHSDEATDFHDKEVDSNLTCSAAIGLDSALNKDGNYYPQMFLKECKYIKQGNDKVYYGRHINFF